MAIDDLPVVPPMEFNHIPLSSICSVLDFILISL